MLLSNFFYDFQALIVFLLGSFLTISTAIISFFMRQHCERLSRIEKSVDEVRREIEIDLDELKKGKADMKDIDTLKQIILDVDERNEAQMKQINKQLNILIGLVGGKQNRRGG